MSTMAEIESAIAHLPAAEREALEGRLLARRFGLEALDAGERAALLASLDEAEREIDSGRSLSRVRTLPNWSLVTRGTRRHENILPPMADFTCWHYGTA